MEAEEVSWKGYEVHAAEAIWVCTESSVAASPGISADRIDYLMKFTARDSRVEGTPTGRNLLLRTSAFRINEEEGFLNFLQLVVDGELLETKPWDRFKEVYDWK